MFVLLVLHLCCSVLDLQSGHFLKKEKKLLLYLYYYLQTEKQFNFVMSSLCNF